MAKASIITHVSADRAVSTFIGKEAGIVNNRIKAQYKFLENIMDARWWMLTLLIIATLIQAVWTENFSNILADGVLILMLGYTVFSALPIASQILLLMAYRIKREWLVRRGVIMKIKA